MNKIMDMMSKPKNVATFFAGFATIYSALSSPDKLEFLAAFFAGLAVATAIVIRVEDAEDDSNVD